MDFLWRHPGLIRKGVTLQHYAPGPAAEDDDEEGQEGEEDEGEDSTHGALTMSTLAASVSGSGSTSRPGAGAGAGITADPGQTSGEAAANTARSSGLSRSNGTT